MRSGYFTASESSNIAVVYALLVTAIVYRSLPQAEFVEATKGAVRTTSMVLLVIGCAACFGWLLAYLKVPTQLVEMLQNVSDNPLVILLLMNVILLIPGHVHGHVAADRHHHADLSAGGWAAGVDPVHFEVILILNLGIGLCTPPVGAGAVRGLRGRAHQHLAGDADDLAPLLCRLRHCDAGDLYPGAVAVAALGLPLEVLN